MSSLLPRASKFRHVVFSDDLDPSGRALNLTPPHDRNEPTESLWQDQNLDTEDESFLEWLFPKAGLSLQDYKRETLKRRIPACFRAVRATTPAQAKAILQRIPSLMPAAINALIIGVTGFFRDMPVFDHLRDSVLPQLLDRPGGLRVWSVGCSDGSELYSVGILLSELRVIHRCYLLGTDCRTDAVRHAAAGLYDSASIKGVPLNLREKYFLREGSNWRIQPWLRTVAQFRSANILDIREPGFFDLILCRNLAIYLEGQATGRLWEELETSLRPSGVLVLGKAERPLGTKTLSNVGPCIYRRNRG